MLILSRKLGEELVIDGRIRVRVINCANGRVRLGIAAPNDVPIVRSEIAFEDCAISSQRSHEVTAK